MHTGAWSESLSGFNFPVTPGKEASAVAYGEHISVLADETIDLLQPGPGAVFIDGTVGGGGHASLLLPRLLPDGRLIAVDKDGSALERARGRLADYGEAAVFVRGDFRHLDRIVAELGVPPVDGVLLDVGVSSFQLDEPDRGFTYNYDVPLDMRMDDRADVSAAELVNTLSHGELARVLRTYGEERHAGRIASVIVAERKRAPVETTGELVELIKRGIPARDRRTGPHPARRTFQALRIAVNDELNALTEGVRAGVDVLKPGGRIAVISFHSLEDRIVKQTFNELADPCTCPTDLPVCRCGRQPSVRVVTRRPIVPKAEEVGANPRARSAKLRVAERIVLVGGEGE